MYPQEPVRNYCGSITRYVREEENERSMVLRRSCGQSEVVVSSFTARLLVIFPLQGRYRTAVTTVWIAAVILGAVCLGIFALALGTGQPGHVTYPFLATGIALTVAFGGTFFPMRSGHREAELRKTVARDI